MGGGRAQRPSRPDGVPDRRASCRSAASASSRCTRTPPRSSARQATPSLADIPFPVDVVDVFRRSDAAGEFADQAVAIGARAVWFQLGVVDEAAFERTVAAGLPMVMDTCPAIEWPRHGESAA